MEILFVGSGTDGGTILKAQGASLIKSGINIDYFFIKRGGIKGYYKSISRLRSLLKKKEYDLIHSHYLLSALITSISTNKPNVVSLMGSDVYDSRFFRWITVFLHFLRWKATIVKSAAMKEQLKLKDIHIIPNGVDTDLFFPIIQAEIREKIGWDQHIYILFGSNPDRKEKNYALAEKACQLLNLTGVKLIPLINITHADIPKYLNACDALLLTSFYEGSPNIVKEAMACNCPVVTTNVGDVQMVLGQTEGCFISGYEPEDIAEKIALAVQFRKKNHFTQGRTQLIDLGLDSNTVARKILDIYIKVTGKQLL